MPRYFFTSLANRPMTLSGRTIRFLVCSLQGGRAVGVFEATDPADEAVLVEAVRAKRGVREIDAAEFETLKKKASQTPGSGSFGVSKGPRVVRIPLLPEVAVAERAGVPSADSKPAERNGEENLLQQPPISKLVRVERVNPPRPFAKAAEKAERAGNRAERAKIRIARRAADES